MIDIRQLVTALSQAICKVDFPDAARLARALNMEISQARVTQMKAGDVIIKGARLNGSSIALDVSRRAAISKTKPGMKSYEWDTKR